MNEARIRERTGRGSVLGSERRFGLLRSVAIALLVVSATAWSRAAAQEQVQDQGPAQQPELGQIQPLSLRYKFVEKYAEAADPAHPERLTQYQVGTREKIQIARDVPQGAPERVQTTLQTIYTERVVKARPNGSASDVVRRYDQSRLSTTVPAVRQFRNPGLLEQLTIWYRVNPGKPVDLFNLTEGRPLRQQEFDRITKNPFVPQLATLLPSTPRRVGDVWVVPRAVMGLLLGEPPLDDEYDISAELIEVRGAAPGGTALTAVLGVKGSLMMMDGPLALNARVHFVFEPAAANSDAAAAAGATTAAQPKRPAGVIEANGYISEVRMAESAVVPLDQEGRLKMTRTRELVLERRLGGDSVLPVVVPDAPVDDPAHTWITYDDPQGGFHLAHPQNLRIAQVYPEGIDLVDRRLDGQDVIQLSLLPKTGDAAKDRLAADPIQQQKALMDQWKAEGQDVLQGPAGWLPEADWASLNRKVYRLEAALKPPADGGDPQVRGGRIYLDRYIVQFARDETLVVTAMTTRDPHIPFRNQVELLIRTFDFGPSEAAPAEAAPAETAPAAPAQQ